MATIEIMIEITSMSIATRCEMRDLATATTTLIATTDLDKKCIKRRRSSHRLLCRGWRHGPLCCLLQFDNDRVSLTTHQHFSMSVISGTKPNLAKDVVATRVFAV
jgi:hypothetical protein